MTWSGAYELTWDHFKAEPNHQTSAAAVTASGITFGFSIKQTDTKVISFTTNVHAHFYPERSWYKKGVADDHVLKHEQLHFDITELYARKFRQRINQLNVSNSIKRTLKNLHQEINKELEMMQDKYDEETDFSRNFEQQAKWETYIAEELRKHSKYKLLN